METIKEKAEKCIPYPCPMWYAGDDEGYEESKKDVDTKRHIFELGANYVLEKIECYIQNYDLGNSAEEKFYKLDVIADIGSYIKKLKAE